MPLHSFKCSILIKIEKNIKAIFILRLYLNYNSFSFFFLLFKCSHIPILAHCQIHGLFCPLLLSIYMYLYIDIYF